MHNLKLIIVREYLARVRNKTFMIMTFVSPVVMVGMVILIAYLASLHDEKVDTVALHDQTESYSATFQSSDDIVYKDLSNLSLAEAIDSSQSAGYTGLLSVTEPQTDQPESAQFLFYSSGSPDAHLISTIEQKLSKAVTDQKLVKNNIDLQQIQNAQTHIELSIENFSGQQTSKMSGYIKMFFGGAAGYLLMMFIIIYGNMVMRSVIEEKTNRIIEIIISSVKPIHLMLGKILGTTIAGITQFLIWTILGTILMFIVGIFFNIDLLSMSQVSATGIAPTTATPNIQALLIDIANLPLLELVVCFLIYFIGGYFLYSAIYAAIGAAVDNETDTQQFIFPVILPLMLGIYVGFFSVMGDPHGSVATIFSYIPLTSPIVMLMRIPFGVAWYEVAISIAILLGSVIGVTWIGAKVYRVGILMYGKKPSYKEIGKWLKY